MIVTEFIKCRKDGKEHSPDDLQKFVDGFVSGEIPDYQVAAWLMATNFNGLSKESTAALTKIMRDSGDTLKFPDTEFIVDKHSTGGVGDKTTMIIAPVVAACGVKVASLAGRGLGHTGGTVDKLESIKGFKTDVSTKDLVSFVLDTGLCITGQTDSICPADKKLYALRDVTATVPSISLIAASILSKKLAEGIKGLVLDVKFGSGAFMKTLEEARELATWLKDIGELNGVKVHAYLTNMNEPLGRYAGNALEIQECVDILKGVDCVENGIDFYKNTRELSLRLAADMVFIGGGASSHEQALELVEDAVKSGRAYEKFLEMVKNQGGDESLNLPKAKHTHSIVSPARGFVSEINVELLGLSAVHLNAGRKKQTDTLDMAAGICWHFQQNQAINEGDPLFTLYSEDESLFAAAEESLMKSITISPKKGKAYKLIEDILR